LACGQVLAAVADVGDRFDQRSRQPEDPDQEDDGAAQRAVPAETEREQQRDRARQQIERGRDRDQVPPVALVQLERRIEDVADHWSASVPPYATSAAQSPY